MKLTPGLQCFTAISPEKVKRHLMPELSAMDQQTNGLTNKPYSS